jgi:hypothetical protein
MITQLLEFKSWLFKWRFSLFQAFSAFPLLAGQGFILYLYFTTRSAAPSAFDMPEGPNSVFLTMALYATLVFVQSISGVSASADGEIRAFTPAIFLDYPDSMLWGL